MSKTSMNRADAYAMNPSTTDIPALCTVARDSIVAAIKSNVRVTEITQANSDATRSNIMTAFYNGPRDAAADFIRQYIQSEYGTSTTSADNLIISQWLDSAKTKLVQNELSMFNNAPDAEDVDKYTKWSKLVQTPQDWMLQIQMATIGYLLMYLSTDSNIDSDTKDHKSQLLSSLSQSISATSMSYIASFVFQPWLLMYYINQFVTNKAFNIHTQIYAYKLFTDIASRAIKKIALTYQPVDTDLNNIANAIPQMLPSTLSSDLDVQIQKVIEKSSQNRKATVQLQSVNASANLRSQRSSDMQVRFQVLEGDVLLMKQTMMMWIIALLAVLGSAIFLVITNHMLPFMMLVFGTVAILVIMIAVPYLYRLMKKKTNTI